MTSEIFRFVNNICQWFYCNYMNIFFSSVNIFVCMRSVIYSHLPTILIELFKYVLCLL